MNYGKQKPTEKKQLRLTSEDMAGVLPGLIQIKLLAQCFRISESSLMRMPSGAATDQKYGRRENTGQKCGALRILMEVCGINIWYCIS